MTNKKILFICLGNICRSPVADAIFKKTVKEAGLYTIEIDSAGLINFHEGEPADSRMRRYALERGYNVDHISRPLRPHFDFEYYDMIIGMDDQNMAELKNHSKKVKPRSTFHLMTDFRKAMTYTQVPDPYYGTRKDFELVIDIVEDACNGLLKHIQNT